MAFCTSFLLIPKILPVAAVYKSRERKKHWTSLKVHFFNGTATWKRYKFAAHHFGRLEHYFIPVIFNVDRWWSTGISSGPQRVLFL